MKSFNEYILEQQIELLRSFDDDFYSFLEPASIIDEKAKSDSDGTQPWAGSSISSNDDDKTIADFLEKEVKPFVDSAFKEYSSGLKKLASFAKNSKVLVDQKSPKSVLSKIKRGKSIETIHDMLRGAILVRTEEDVKTIDKKVKSIFRIYKREFKDFGSDKELGYFGSYHYKVELKNGLIAEIQLMTKTLWANKSEAHNIYNIVRDKLAIDKSFSKSKEFRDLQKRSKDLFIRGSGIKTQIR